MKYSFFAALLLAGSMLGGAETFRLAVDDTIIDRQSHRQLTGGQAAFLEKSGRQAAHLFGDKYQLLRGETAGIVNPAQGSISLAVLPRFTLNQESPESWSCYYLFSIYGGEKSGMHLALIYHQGKYTLNFFVYDATGSKVALSLPYEHKPGQYREIRAAWDQQQLELELDGVKTQAALTGPLSLGKEFLIGNPADAYFADFTINNHRGE